MVTLTAKQAQLFTNPNFAVVATLGKDGTPQTSVVWIDYDGRNVLFNTTRSRAKGRNLARDPRVSVTVFDLGNPYAYVEIEGTAELEDEGANEHINELSHKYNGRDFTDRHGRVIVRVTAMRVHASGIE
jgi:PPOX class probable F420-dependent enzyme